MRIDQIVVNFMIEPEQVRAARAMIGLSQEELSRHTGINRRTLMNYENGVARLKDATVARIVEALMTAGIEFLRNDRGDVGISLSYDALLNARSKNRENPSNK
jgi:transcriptional regulator with XRE-family HTH domain